MSENLDTTRSSVIMAMSRRIKELEAKSIEQEKEIERLNKELEIWSARSYDGKIGSLALKNLNLKMEINKLEITISNLEKQIIEPKQTLKHGSWGLAGIISCQDGLNTLHRIICSRCAKDMIIPEYNIPNYCPNCGADMRDKYNE